MLSDMLGSRINHLLLEKLRRISALFLYFKNDLERVNMKKLISLLVVILITTTQSQSIMRIWKGGVRIDSVTITNNLQVTFGTGSGDFNCGSQIVYSGITYNTVQIGNQCWLKENLNVGVFVPSVNTGSSHSDVSDNGIIEKYCYNNDTVNCNTYGGLYDWNEAVQYINVPGTRGICPTGWHIPTYAVLQTLKSATGNDGNSLKAVGQGSGAGAGTNTFGFSALLTGYRHQDGNFYSNFAFFWSSTEYAATDAYYLYLTSSSSTIGFDLSKRDYGYSVRCVKDY
jgi:uncharacterized protein (TIGR02145 family)